MSVIITEECVTRPDGTLICWDREERCYYQLNKQKISANDLSKEELSGLIELIGKPRGAMGA